MIPPFEYPLGTGTLTLSGESVQLLVVGLYKSPIYPHLRNILEGMKESCDVELRNTAARIDEIRVTQGKLMALAELVTLLERYLPEFYNQNIRKDTNVS